MKKVNFVKLINGIVYQTEKEREFSEALAPFFDGHFVSMLSDKIIDVILSVVEDEMNDAKRASEFGSLIAWWIYDAPKAGKNKEDVYVVDDNNKIILETPEQLYDYLMGIQYSDYGL